MPPPSLKFESAPTTEEPWWTWVDEFPGGPENEFELVVRGGEAPLTLLTFSAPLTREQLAAGFRALPVTISRLDARGKVWVSMCGLAHGRDNFVAVADRVGKVSSVARLAVPRSPWPETTTPVSLAISSLTTSALARVGSATGWCRHVPFVAARDLRALALPPRVTVTYALAGASATSMEFRRRGVSGRVGATAPPEAIVVTPTGDLASAPERGVAIDREDFAVLLARVDATSTLVIGA